MKSVNSQLLARLANNDVNNAVADYGALPLDIKASLERQIAEQRQEVVDSAATEIVNLLSNKDEFLTTNQMQIAALEDQVKGLKSLQEKVQRSTQYGMSTQNFLPLLKLTGGSVPTGTARDVSEVPKDWAPASTATTQS
jgi:hypothetical protein